TAAQAALPQPQAPPAEPDSPVDARLQIVASGAKSVRVASAAENETRSDVTRGLPIPEPPFFGACLIDDLTLEETFPFINETALIRGRWQVRKRDMADDEFEELLNSKIRPAPADLKQQCLDQRLLLPQAVYGYFPCQSEGNDLIVYRL